MWKKKLNSKSKWLWGVVWFEVDWEEIQGDLATR